MIQILKKHIKHFARSVLKLHTWSLGHPICKAWMQMGSWQYPPSNLVLISSNRSSGQQPFFKLQDISVIRNKQRCYVFKSPDCCRDICSNLQTKCWEACHSWNCVWSKYFWFGFHTSQGMTPDHQHGTIFQGKKGYHVICQWNKQMQP